MSTRQKGNITVILLVIIVLVAGAGAYYFGFKQGKRDAPTSQSETNLKTQTEELDWKTYKGPGYSLSYPKSWIYDPSLEGLNATDGSEGFVIVSPDYSHSPAGYPKSGGVIRLLVNDELQANNLAVVSEEEKVWLGQKASLKHSRWESDILALSANFGDKFYTLLLISSTDEFREQNKDLLLKIAETLKLE